MKTTHERKFRHPNHETALLTCDIRGENNFVVACYRGSDQGIGSPVPSGLARGGVEAARKAWASMQARLIDQGFVIV